MFSFRGEKKDEIKNALEFGHDAWLVKLRTATATYL